MKSCPSCNNSYPVDYSHCPRDLTPLVEASLWSAGQVVRGKYRILDSLGTGGMAVVYKAEHIHFHELRALKVINQQLAGDPSFVQRFMQEAVITRSLQHPHAVRIDDIDLAEDGPPFIVMECIQGRSLSDVIREQGPMEPARVCSLIHQAASALDAAHKLGIVHRDIKPSNMILVESQQGEEVKVLDFGIAKLKEAPSDKTRPGQASLTATGLLIGTPAYMSPEQAIGKKGEELDGRSDLYSLGVVMYQMLSGDLPLKADSDVALLMAHISTPPTPIRSIHPQIPEPIAEVVMQCLEKQRDARPASGAVLMEEIEAAQAGIAPPTSGQVRAATATTLRSGSNADCEAATEMLTPVRRAGNLSTQRTVALSPASAHAPVKGRTSMPKPAHASKQSVYLLVGGLLLAGVIGGYVFYRHQQSIPQQVATPTEPVPSAAASPSSTPVIVPPTPSPETAAPSTVNHSKPLASKKQSLVAANNTAHGAPAKADLAATPAPTPTPTPVAIASPAAPQPRPSPSLIAQAQQAGQQGNWDEAARIYKRAADGGNPQAMFQLGKMYENGLGVPQDFQQARQFYQGAINSGNTDAMISLGGMYEWAHEKSKEYPKDYPKARQLYEQAHLSGSSKAAWRIGYMYELAHGFPRPDYQQAADWYEKGVAARDGDAMFRLGYLYEKGRGVKKDDEQARQWYTKAADAGSESAKDWLKKISKGAKAQ